MATRIVVVGGLARLESRYRNRTGDVRVEVANEDSSDLDARVRSASGVILVLGNVSHNAADKVRRRARHDGLKVEVANGAGVGTIHRTIDRLLAATS